MQGPARRCTGQTKAAGFDRRRPSVRVVCFFSVPRPFPGRPLAGRPGPRGGDRALIDLRVLGSPELRGDDGEEVRSILRQPKTFALLVYLAVADPAGFHRRDELLALFWPEVEAASVRARVALARGETAAGLHLLEATGMQWSKSQPEVSLVCGLALERFPRAEALVELGRGEEALPWLTTLGELGPLEWVYVAPSRLRAAEILEEGGSWEAARTHRELASKLWAP